MSEAVKAFQKQLAAQGFDAGRPDGWAGRNTADALDDLLTSLGFEVAVTGNRTRLTVTPVHKAVAVEDTDPDLPSWMRLTLAYVGLHEVRDNAPLREFLLSDGGTIGDPSHFPWCGDLVHTAIRRTLPEEPIEGRVRENPYLARNWLAFGESCAPGVGAVLVFHRGNPRSIYGHVGFYWGEDEAHYYVLGGNQSNSISITRIAKNRLLGARWPSSADRAPGQSRYVDDPSIRFSINEA